VAGGHAHHRGGGAARAGRDLHDGRPVQHHDGDHHRGHDGEYCQGVTQALLTASGFITNPSRTQGGHLWWRRSADGGSVCIGTVIMWVQYNTTAAKTWQVTIYSARHPAGLIVASRTFSLKRGWYWWGFGVHQYYQGLHAVCISATESFGMACVDFSGPAG
jgi:hypothetical protein